MTLLLLVVSALLLVVTLLPFSRSKVWWVRVWDFPRLQLVVMLAATLVLLGFFPLDTVARNVGVWIVLLACLAWQLFWVAPYTRVARKEVRQATDPQRAGRLKLVAANVLMSNREVGRFVSLIAAHQPDVLITLESNEWWQAQLDRLGDRYPYSCKCPLENRYGMHVYSALPIIEADIRYLIESSVPSMRLTLALASGREVQMHVLHPKPPSPTESDTSEERDAELVTIGREVAGSSTPVIVAGDLNDVAWSRTTRQFRKISGLLDPRRGRGMFNTFHAGYPILRFPLDHIFHSSHFAVAVLQRLPAIGSDHFPVLIELQLQDQRPP